MNLTCVRCHHDWELLDEGSGFLPLSNVAWSLTQVRCPQCNADNTWVYRRSAGTREACVFTSVEGCAHCGTHDVRFSHTPRGWKCPVTGTMTPFGAEIVKAKDRKSDVNSIDEFVAKLSPHGVDLMEAVLDLVKKSQASGVRLERARCAKILREWDDDSADDLFEYTQRRMVARIEAGGD